MKLDIRSSMLVLVLVPITLIVVLLVYLTHARVQDLERGLAERGLAIAQQVARIYGHGLLSLDHETLTALAGSVLGETDVVGITLLDPGGRTMISALREPVSSRGPWLVEAVPLPAQSPLVLEIPAPARGEMSRPLGRVRLTLSRHSTELRQKEVIANSLLLTLCCLLVAVWLGQRIGRRVSDPILRLETAVRALGEGQLDTRVAEQASGELGSLERGINAMAAALQSSHEHLQEQVEMAVAEQQETLEELEIKNAELDIARKRAVQASRVKSEFLANMSHEIRTPMNGVMGFVELLAKTPLNRTQQGYLQTLRASAEHLMVVLNDILDFTKIEAGKLQLRCWPFELRETLENTVALYAVNARHKGLRLILEVDPALPRILVGDAARLAQVLGNLISNAIKFTQRGRVEVRAGIFGQQGNTITLELEVQDSGEGIAEADQGRLFKAFEQLDTSSTRRHGGTGLGLAITRRLVELMGGGIRLDSRIGRGTRVRLHLTLERQPDPEPLQPAIRGRVVVITPDTLLGRSLGHSLALGGLEALTAADPESAGAPGNGHAPPVVGMILDLEQLAPSHLPLDERLRRAQLRGLDTLILVGPQDNDLTEVPLLALFGTVQRAALPLTTRELLALFHTSATRQCPAEEAPRRPPLSTPERRPWVLLADDNEINRHLAQIMITQSGARVDEVCNGREAVEACRRKRYDLILMDIHMPELDGVEATRTIRTLPAYDRRPIVALTADVVYGERSRYRQAGMDDCLAKPVTQEMIREALRRWCSPGGDPPPPAPIEDMLHESTPTARNTTL